MMRKRLLVFFAVMFVLSASLFVGCGAEPVKPDLKDLSVNVTDAPAAIDLGTYTLENVFVNEKAFTSYSVKNGKLNFTFATYATLGEGTHNVKLVFKEEELKFKITVTDPAKPNYSYALESAYVFGSNQALILPTVTRNDTKNYDIKYTLSKGSTQIFEKNNLERESETFELGDLQPGEYTVKVEVIDKDTTVGTRTSVVTVREEVNYAAAECIEDEAEIFSYTAFIGLSYRADKNALAIERILEDAGMASRLVLSSSTIAEEVADGANTLTLTYRIEGEGTGTFGAVEYATTDEFDSGEVVRTFVPESAAHDAWVTKKFRISEFADENYFVLLPRHADGETVYLREMFFETFDGDQLVAEDGVDLWETATDSSLKVSYSDGMLHIERIAAISEFSNAAEYARISLDWFRAWKTVGKSAVEFEVKANDTLKVSPDAFTLSVVAREKQQTDETTVEVAVYPAYGAYQVTVTNTTAKIYVDLDALLALRTDAEELAVSVNGEEGSILSIKSITFADSEALAAFDEARYETENYADSLFGWSHTSGQFIGVSYDAALSAIKATVNEKIEQEYYNSTNAKFFFGSHDLKAALESGKKYLKFSYRSDLEGLVFRVFNHTVNEPVIEGGVPRFDAVLLGIDRAFTVGEANAWETGYISLENFFSLEQSEGIFAFGLCGDKGTSLWIKDICFAGDAEYKADLRAQDAFSAENVPNWNRFANNSTGVALSYDAAESAMCFAPAGTDGISGRHYAVYYDAAVLRALYANGTPAVTFEIKVNATAAGDPAYGLRFFGDTELAHRIDTGAPSTSFVYADYLSKDLSTDVYTTIWIDLEGFLKNDFRYFGFVPSGAAGSQFWIRNLTAKTDAEYDEYRAEQVKEMLAAQNFTSSAKLWTSAAPAYHLGIGYNEAESALTVKQVIEANNKNFLSSNMCLISMPGASVKTLYDTYKNFGANYLKFSYRVVNPAANEIAALRLMGSKDPNDFSGTYKVYYAKEQWQTAVISLDEFFAMPGYADFFTFVCAVSADATIEIKDMKFATPEENAAYIEGVDILSKDEYAYYTDEDGTFTSFAKHGNNWKMDDPYYFRGYEASDGAVRWHIQSGYTGALNQQDFVIYYAANYLKQARDAGFTKLTFQVKVDAAFLAAEGATGVRIFAKERPEKTSGANIVTSVEQGIWQYKDVTFTEADTYQAVEIVIADFLQAGDSGVDANWIGFVLGGPNGSNVTFKDFTLAK